MDKKLQNGVVSIPHDKFNLDKARQKKADKSEEKTDLLSLLLDTQAKLKKLCSTKVVFRPPLITRLGEPIIKQGSINIIQGKYGSHKSRLAELFCSILLAQKHNPNKFLGFRSHLDDVHVSFVDTERNTTDEFPYAIQKMKTNAGYDMTWEHENFTYTSLKHFSIKDRRNAIETWIKHLREKTDKPLFVLLDVVTDCVSSFNDDKEAMMLFNFLGRLVDQSNTTFLLVIHENPGSEKSRGHVGTEGSNKSGTVMQIGFEIKGGEPSEIIRLKFLKTRGIKRPEKMHLTYSEKENGLVIAPDELTSDFKSPPSIKAPVEEVKEILLDWLKEGDYNDSITKNEVINDLMTEFSCGKRTIQDRLKAIEDDPQLSESLELKTIHKRGKSKRYLLSQISNINVTDLGSATSNRQKNSGGLPF